MITPAASPENASPDFRNNWRILESRGTSLAAARNLARSSAAAPSAAFVDGTDPWYADWLRRGVVATIEQAAIWRPELLITFAQDALAQEACAVLTQADDSHDGAAALLAPEPQLAGFLAPLSLLQTEPWPAEDAGRGWGLTDAWWSCNLAAHGCAHRTLPGSIHDRRVPRGFNALHAGQKSLGATRLEPTPFNWMMNPNRLRRS